MIKKVGSSATLILFFLFYLSIAHANETLTLSIHPYKSASDLHKAFEPLAQYLSRVTHTNIQLHVAKDYQSHIDLIGRNKVDIAYMGPASYLRLVKIYGKKRLLARLAINGEPTFKGMIIVPTKSNITTLQMLADTRFAFGSAASTMSHLVPRYMLLEAGIPVTKLKKHAFLGNHANVALGVLSGNYDAGAVKEAIFFKYQSQGLRVLAETPPLSEHLFVVNDNLNSNLVKKLKNALLKLHTMKQNIVILQSIKKTASALASVKDSDYENLRKILHTLETENTSIE